MIRALSLVLALVAAAPALAGASAPATPPADEGGESADGPRQRALAFAHRKLGRRFASDCSGFVLAAFREAGIRPTLRRGRSRSESLHRASRAVTQPRPGDLAFFHHTYDRNRDGRVNDPFSHVALVETVDGDAVTLLHRGARGIERVRMNLRRPSDPAANDPVRWRRKRDPRRLRVLSGELFAGYGALPGT